MIFASLALALLITAQTAPGELEDYQLVAINGSFSAPLQVTAPDGDSRIFIVERGGRVKVAINDSALSVPFIDISARLTHSPGGEQGLLGMAFHPSYDVNGRFFLAHTDVSGDLVVAEFHASPSSNVADPNLVQKVISIDEPFRNHNGGSVVFGTDGLLYIGVGDGGGVGDPFGHGQRTATLLGSILRIDVDGDSFPGDPGRNYAIPAGNPFVASPGADEIWHYGLRNPWRFAIDPDTGRFYVADVGQDLREEVTVLEPDSGGSNLGWDRLEGTRCYPNGGVCNTAGTVLPQVEYSHSVGRSVTGGPVYRGSELPELDGTYFYGDFAAGWIRSFTYNGAVSNHHDWSNTLGSTPLISSFGLDGHGELYVVSIRGNVWRLEGRSNLQTIGDWTGDGRTDLAIRRGGNWLSSTSSANSGSEFSVWSSFATQTGWGRSLTADFDNDGRDDIADFHPSNGTWWVSRSTGSGFTTAKWADFTTSKGWGPQIVGDFNGDGRDDIVNYHSSNGTWWVSRSTGSGFTTTKWAG